MISATWLKSLRLEDRKSPEFIQSGDDLGGVRHSSLIRKSFDELGLAAVHCISGVPSVAFLVQDSLDQNQIDKVHKALWNQGLATLLLVITGDTLRAYSLSQLPKSDQQSSERLVKVFDLLSDALELKDLVLGVESGRFVNEHSEKFDTKYRVDQILLTNLETTVKRLVGSGLQLESAQALLMQIMFIAYLEDKEIINAEYFYAGTGNSKIDSLVSLLGDRHVAKFNKLFKLLKEHFNGDLFVAPCSFEVNEQVEKVTEEHIEVLSEFRAGNVDLNSGQFQFWPYDFKFIPIDLISAVYDRFLGYDPITRRESGAYYTPMFLADLVAEQAWSELSAKQRSEGKFVDPSCGSGIFLVRLFEKAIDEWQVQHNNQRPTWPALKAMLKRIHGFDVKKEAVRVAAFSLYIALLENTRPAELLALMEKGRLLPKLCGETLNAIDFFEVDAGSNKYDLIVGNPPWISRRGDQKIAEHWCKENGYEMPAKEMAWDFAWKALSHANKDGVAALLLKATSFLTNHSPTFIKTRKQWMSRSRIKRIVNFADTRFQLFEGGDAPAVLAIYQPIKQEGKHYSFDYWVPKADLNLKTNRLMTLSSADQAKLPIDLVIKDQLFMKRRMWMQTPDEKLFQYLSGLPKLERTLVTYQQSRKIEADTDGKWIIGQGFKPAQENKLNDSNYKTSISEIVDKIPHLPTNMFKAIVMPEIETGGWNTNLVHRKGFEQGFKAPHVLIPQGVSSEQGRLRASFCDQDLSFRDSIQAISFDRSEEDRAKFLTVLLNSSFTAWFLFHHSSNTGMERDKVHQEQLLDIPFPLPEDMNDASRARKAFKHSVELIDRLAENKGDLLVEESSQIYSQIDRIVCDYFGLGASDIFLIEDTLNHIVSSMQPRANSKKTPSLWMDTTEKDWANYSESLSSSLERWIDAPLKAVSEVGGVSKDLVVLAVQLTSDTSMPRFSNNQGQDVDIALSKIWRALPKSLPGNFQLIPDLRIFIDDILYIVKPRKKRFWLRSTAFADADAIASDLLSQQG
ncbi:N-6 DNA methylase [Exilibacterium tricleocarpae]|uniref:site-specific DNA-methyltransferase (adenine-specific) n=1 Tax=Exilibacterium tricleocarpae TaxID=2591008 RepID=A0A545U8E9_9GAMM|nr:N-6 DNA methylase [Exilibacterium tricleocarpae]TQV85741.1 N-6 DNA methylase [Exilibacterium tricleocarpae]